ncbi:MAG: NAD-dependent epimerase/dehydratase family protein [Porticoccaceae bacterium]
MTERQIGLLGATSLVGECLLPLLGHDHWRVTAFSRQPLGSASADVEWRRLPMPVVATEAAVGDIPCWICLAPIWVLPEHFALLEKANARRIVVLSSTSRFSKSDSSDADEQRVAEQLAAGEARLREWALARGVEWVVLRPTLIYGLGRDHNISEIARLIRRCHCFPLLGRADGLRQPIHARDVAAACLGALNAAVANRAYDLAGGETLSYRAMVERVFAALGRRPRLVSVPLAPFRLVIALLRRLPRYRHWTAAMVERMNRDLVFDHRDAARDFGFLPRRFQLDPEDLPH